MLNLLRKNKAVVKFILTFLTSYFVLALIYNWYLDAFVIHANSTDFLTRLVAFQSEAVITAFGYDAQVFQDIRFPIMNLWVNSQFVSRIIEGCNSASIIILFISFMIAFFGKIKTTLFYILAGSVIIYTMNIVRIAMLSIGIYELPQYGHFLHKIAFPLLIYGSVFILWIIWVRIYSKQNRA